MATKQVRFLILCFAHTTKLCYFVVCVEKDLNYIHNPCLNSHAYSYNVYVSFSVLMCPQHT